MLGAYAPCGGQYMAALDGIDVEHVPVLEPLAEPASEVPGIAAI